jgi:hypothetical protein
MTLMDVNVQLQEKTISTLGGKEEGWAWSFSML